MGDPQKGWEYHGKYLSIYGCKEAQYSKAQDFMGKSMVSAQWLDGLFHGKSHLNRMI